MQEAQSWDEPEASISPHKGILIIRQTARVHKAIEEALNNLRNYNRLQVEFEVSIAELPRAFWDDIRNSEITRPGQLSIAQVKKIREFCLNDKNAELVREFKLKCYNTQRAFIADIEQHRTIMNLYNENVNTGFIFEVMPIASHDRKFITIELRPRECDDFKMDIKKAPRSKKNGRFRRRPSQSCTGSGR